MQRSHGSARIAGAVVLGVVFLYSCSGHHSISNTPATTPYLPAVNIPGDSASAATLHITNLDGGGQTSATQGSALSIVNGSRLRVSLTGDSVISAAVEAGDSSALLVPTGEGQWTATVRYVDSSNPPVQNPMLEVKVQTQTGRRTFRIPVLELHD